MGAGHDSRAGEFPHQPDNGPAQVPAGGKAPGAGGQQFAEDLVLFRFGKAETRDQPQRLRTRFPSTLQAKDGEMEKMPRFKIHATPVLFPGKREKNRVRRNQKRASFDFPMEMSLGNVVQFEPAVLMLGQPCDAAAAEFLEQIEKLAWFAGQSADHDCI